MYSQRKKIFVSAFIFFLFPIIVFGAIDSPQKVIDTIELLSRWMLGFLLSMAVIFILVSAWNFLSAGGEKEKIESAKKQLMYTIAAVAIALVAKALVELVKAFITG